MILSTSRPPPSGLPGPGRAPIDSLIHVDLHATVPGRAARRTAEEGSGPRGRDVADVRHDLGGLRRVEPGIADGLVVVGQVALGHAGTGPADALGDRAPDRLQVHAARPPRARGQDLEEAGQLGLDDLDVPGLVAAGRPYRVAVHR